MAVLMSQPIPPKYAVACVFCHEVLDRRDRGVFQKTTGWVMNREAGGGHAVSLPERMPCWAHGLCVDRARKGTLGQTSLLGD